MVSLPKKSKPETRLVRDDEDFGEGFDEFVEDGRITLGRKAEREQRRRHKAEMQELIQNAEGSESADSDDSEAERNAAYEAAQTRAGMDGLKKNGTTDNSKRSQTPAKITPLPNFPGCTERFRTALANMEYSKMQSVKRLEDLKRERAEIAARKVEVQKLLSLAGENYEKLRLEAGIGANELETSNDGNSLPTHMTENRGLESFGNSPIPSAGIGEP